MSLPTLTISAGSGWLDQRDRFSGNIAGNEQKNYTLLRKGELSYNHGNSKLAKYGAVYRLTTHEEALVPRVYHSFRTVNGASPEFIEYLFATKIPDKELGKLISSGARMDGLLNINYEDFMGIRVVIPLPEEQKYIGRFFVKIDTLISLHQRKLDNVKMLKKSLLQKLFPKDGEKIPELRFPGFTDAWEQRKLGEITSLITKGTTPKKQSLTGEVNFVKVENINEQTNRIYPSARISLEEHQTYLKRSQLQDGDILFSIAGTLGRIGVVNSKILPANTNQAVAILRVREENLNYIKTVLQGNAIRDYIRQNPTVGAQPNLSLSQISEFKIGVPSLDEQILVGEFFIKMDSLISLHQRKLDHLKELKKGLLQQMFV